MSNKVSAVIFEGSSPLSLVEEMMVRVREAALLDNLEKLTQVPEIRDYYLFTNRPELEKPASRLGAQVFLNNTDPRHFHFGETLKSAVMEHGLRKVFCLSGAGCPLITVQELKMVARKLVERENYVYTNNTQSSDMTAFTVTQGFATAALPAMDNSLALSLRDQLGLEMELMPHTLGLLFDIDTPSDLLVLGAGPFGGPRTRMAIADLKLDYQTLNAAKQVLGAEYEEVALIGRVGAPVIGRLNADLKLRLRVFSEERGMKSLGRIENNEVISLLGLLLDHAGIDHFFEYLTRVARCAFIDSRVLFYHYQLELADRERFLSDLGCWEELENPWLRNFTRAAVTCKIPVLLGGHSLVSGSLWALCDELVGSVPGIR
ncbi:MAG: hypothetical protein FJ152_03475 [Firmicutes bacterium]|nr:hypothetical protein [Bacillota bacterium]